MVSARIPAATVGAIDEWARVRPALNLSIATAFAVVLGACAGSQQATVQEPGVAQEMPATVRADQIVGRWGVASYQDPKDRTRVEAAAKAQCKLPYVITAGASGGVVMHLADEAAPQDLRLKGSPGGKNYIPVHPDLLVEKRIAKSFPSIVRS